MRMPSSNPWSNSSPRNVHQARCDAGIADRQQRLPGFSGEWEVTTFGDVFTVIAGGDVDPNEQYSTKTKPIVPCLFKCAYGLRTLRLLLLMPITKLVCYSDGTWHIGFANFRDHAFTAIGRVLVLYPKQESHGRFFAEVINNRIKF